MTDPYRPEKERILDDIIATDFQRKAKLTEVLVGKGKKQTKAASDLKRLDGSLDSLIDDFNQLAGKTPKPRT